MIHLASPTTRRIENIFIGRFGFFCLIFESKKDERTVGRPSGSISVTNIQDRFVINDPLGQAHSLAISEHCFHLNFVLF